MKRRALSTARSQDDTTRCRTSVKSEWRHSSRMTICRGDRSTVVELAKIEVLAQKEDRRLLDLPVSGAEYERVIRVERAKAGERIRANIEPSAAAPPRHARGFAENAGRLSCRRPRHTNTASRHRWIAPRSRYAALRRAADPAPIRRSRRHVLARRLRRRSCFVDRRYRWPGAYARAVRNHATTSEVMRATRWRRVPDVTAARA